MRLPDDDELYEVDQTYLGPPKRYIGEMRYRTLFAFIVIAPTLLVLTHRIGIPLNLLSVGLGLLSSSWLSMKAADAIGHESSASSWAATAWHELIAPRGGGRPFAVSAAGRLSAVLTVRGGWARAERRRAEAAVAAATSDQTASVQTTSVQTTSDDEPRDDRDPSIPGGSA